MKIKFYEVFDEEEKVLRELMPDAVTCEYTHQTIQESGDHSPMDVISIRTQSIIPHAWRDSLGGIITRSQGYDHLLKYKKETKTDMAFGYLGHYCSRSVAEHAIMMMFNLLRGLKAQTQHFEKFNRDGLTGRECYNKEALVVGVGAIGSEIVMLARACGLEVRGVDIDEKRDDLKYINLAEGIKKSDVIFCALPLTKKTEGLLDYNALINTFPGSILINISRGEITPVNDLRQLLDEGVLGGLAMDVFPAENEFAGLLRGTSEVTDRSHRIIMDLAKRDNVILTPHNAFNTKESLRRKADLTVKSIQYYLRNNKFLTPMPSI